MTVEMVAEINIVLGLVGFVWLLLRTSLRRHEYPDEVLWLLFLALTLFFGLLAVSITLRELAGAPLTLAALIGGVKAFSLFVLWRTRHTKYRTGTRAVDGNPGADQNKDVL